MSAVTLIVIVLLAAVFLLATATISVSARDPIGPEPEPRFVPMATSGNSVFMAWANNDTGHFNVFFAKSADGGKTLKTTMISAPNNGNTIDQNTEISASGNHVYVTWWTNKTGILMPVFRASNDTGETFAKTVTLNSTGVPMAVPKLK